jgi:hypothetical protein
MNIIRRSEPAKGPEDIGRKYMSNSYLGRVKNQLFGIPPFEFPPDFFVFGDQFHKRILLDESEFEKKILTDEEEERLAGMTEAANRFIPLQEILDHKDVEKEIRCDTDDPEWLGMMGYLDIKHGRRGVDLKSTSATSYAGFVRAARKYDYFRQGVVYKKIGPLDEYIIAGVQKKPPHQIFWLDVDCFEPEMLLAERETKLLLHIIKHYEL